jgi:hypothetical protein
MMDTSEQIAPHKDKEKNAIGIYQILSNSDLCGTISIGRNMCVPQSGKADHLWHEQ